MSMSNRDKDSILDLCKTMIEEKIGEMGSLEERLAKAEKRIGQYMKEEKIKVVSDIKVPKVPRNVRDAGYTPDPEEEAASG